MIFHATHASVVATGAFDAVIVSPIMNEEENLGTLMYEVQQQAKAHAARYMLIFIDDSSTEDRCGSVIEAFSRQRNDNSLVVQQVYRKKEERTGGLSGAVTHGIRIVQERQLSSYVIVMDGDGQHDPAYIPTLLAQLQGADLVIASRYRNGGSNEGLSGTHRRLVSYASTRLAKGLFPRRMSSVTDPMTGYFGMRLDSTGQGPDLVALKPDGFKILVEIILSSRHLQIAEIPFVFRQRENGESKGTVSQGLKFLKQLMRHRVRLR